MQFGRLAAIFLVSVGAAWGLTPDATREQVIAELGKPTSVAAHGGREILIYPKGVRLELEGGRIVSAKGIALSDAVAAPVATEAAPPGKRAEKAPGAAEKDKKQVTTAKEVAAIKPAQNDALADMAKTVDKMEASNVAAQHPPPPKAFDFVGFAVEVALKFLLIAAALKLACKYWGAEVSWTGLVTVAAADVVVRGGMGLVGTLLLGFPSLFYADEAVGALVMVLLLKKLSYNHSLAQAVELTITSKTFSIVVGAFLVTMILRLLH